MPRIPFRTLLCGVSLVLTLAAPGAAAQVRGMVVDPAGHPVAGAALELWEATRLIASTRTDSAGAFAFPSTPAAGPLVASVRRVGMRIVTVEVTPADTALVLRMEEQPVALATLHVVRTPERTCPNREDPRARALWERMRSRYWQEGMDTVRVLGVMEMRSGTGEKEEVHLPDAGRTRAAWSYGALIVPPPWQSGGYGFRVTRSVGERTAFWNYRKLDGGLHQDFTHGRFGTEHTFSLVGATTGRFGIAFCPRERPREAARIEGVLFLAPDTTLSAARWRFRTPAPDEDAGGEAVYFPPEARFGNALLAEETLFSRRTTAGRYYFEARKYSAWRPWDGRPGPVP